MKRKNITNWLVIATLTSILTACGGGSGGSSSSNLIDNNTTTNENNNNSNAEDTNVESNTTTEDTQAPTILSVSPSDLETEVALDVNISLLFDENMLASSLNNRSISLNKSNNATVEGNVSFNATSTATFSPTKKLALLSDYVLSVNTSVSDLAGNTLESEEKFNFTTRDGEWKEAELLEINNAGSAGATQVAIDSSGNAIAVWQQFDGTRSNILANKFSPKNGWGSPEKIETDDTEDAFVPQIAIDSSGNAIAVWSQFDGFRFNIWANRFTSSTSTWGTAEKIQTDSEDASSPQVSMDDSGNAIAIWKENDGRVYNIWSNHFSITSGWGNPERIDNDDDVIIDGKGDSSSPQISLDSLGNAIAVWSQRNGSQHSILASRFTLSGGWNSPEKIEDDDTGDSVLPQVSIDSSGNAIVVWEQFDGTRTNILANKFTSSTSAWSSAEQIETDDTGDADSPQISIDSLGNAIAVWEQFDGTRYNIWANRFTPTSGWGTAEKIETDDTGNANFPQFSIDSSGNAIAVWVQFDGTRNNIWANRFSSSTNAWGTAEKIENDDTGDADLPQVSIDSSGNAIAVWEQSDGTRKNILVNHFE